MNRLKILYLLFIHVPLFYIASGQQNNTLFFLHQVPQTNFINPAVQIECKFYIGLPVISSLHANVAHNGFTVKQLLNEETDSTYAIDANMIENKLARRNYLISELYTNILAVGFRNNDNYYTFAVRERNDLAFFYTRDLITLFYKGNSQFEGELLPLNGNGLKFNHFREYSLGLSRKIDEDRIFGVRAKLLFGKLNLITSQFDGGLYTDENTFDLEFSGNVRSDASLPIQLYYDYNDLIRINENYSPSVKDIILNRKNYGFAVDLGFIYHTGEDLTVSGSILDLGFVRYRSYLSNYTAYGQHSFNGFLGDPDLRESYWRNYFQDFNGQVNDTLTHEAYTYFLPPRIYTGISKKISKKLSVNALIASKIYKETLVNGLSVTSNYSVGKFLTTSLSWSYIHRSAKNVGFGLVLGRNPVQFYAVTDNILGLIWPASTKNLNICFGLNILLGCKNNNEYTEDQGCYWLRKAEDRNERKQRLSKKRSRF